MRSRRSGLTMFELLVAAIISAIVATALARAFSFAATYTAVAEESRTEETARLEFEESIAKLLRAAIVSSDANDTSTYFLAGTDATGEEGRVTFTVQAPPASGAILASTEGFESQNERFGPQAGPLEVSIGMMPVGQASVNTGVFLREQRPADGDPTQGGTETVLTQAVVELQFEFYDGTTWQTSWDTRTGQRRLPAAARVSYVVDGEEQTRGFLVRLRYSDVTPENPYSTTPDEEAQQP